MKVTTLIVRSIDIDNCRCHTNVVFKCFTLQVVITDTIELFYTFNVFSYIGKRILIIILA